MKRPAIQRFEQHVAPGAGGCRIWGAGKFRGGYGMFWLDGGMRSAHRVAYELYVGNIPDGMHVCHRCDVRSCVNPEHLFLGTNADNIADKVAKGRQARNVGESHPGHKLRAQDVLRIRADARPSSRVAAEFGVSKKAILNIRRGRSWGHL